MKSIFNDLVKALTQSLEAKFETLKKSLDKIQQNFRGN